MAWRLGRGQTGAHEVFCIAERFVSLRRATRHDLDDLGSTDQHRADKQT